MGVPVASGAPSLGGDRSALYRTRNVGDMRASIVPRIWEPSLLYQTTVSPSDTKEAV